MSESLPAVRAFLDAFGRKDVDAALAVVDDAVTVTVHPLGVAGGGIAELRTVLTDIVTAFPDLRVTVAAILDTPPSVTAEFTVEGTQAADYVGVINQEKHLDVAQAWQFTVADGRITDVRAYWCQAQLYRRLAVKRFDQIAIV